MAYYIAISFIIFLTKMLLNVYCNVCCLFRVDINLESFDAFHNNVKHHLACQEPLDCDIFANSHDVPPNGLDTTKTPGNPTWLAYDAENPIASAHNFYCI